MQTKASKMTITAQPLYRLAKEAPEQLEPRVAQSCDENGASKIAGLGAGGCGAVLWLDCSKVTRQTLSPTYGERIRDGLLGPCCDRLPPRARHRIAGAHSR